MHNRNLLPGVSGPLSGVNKEACASWSFDDYPDNAESMAALLHATQPGWESGVRRKVRGLLQWESPFRLQGVGSRPGIELSPKNPSRRMAGPCAQKTWWP
jgi:hypothetical protein